MISQYAVFQGQKLVTAEGLDQGCLQCAKVASTNGDARSQTCARTGREARVAWQSSASGLGHEIVVCSADTGASNRRINTQVRTLLPLIDGVIRQVEDGVASGLRSDAERSARRFGRLMHNLVTYNAKSRQALELVVSEWEISHATYKRGAVETALKGNPTEAADSVLKVIKNLALTSAEFRVWNYLYSPKGPPKLEMKRQRFHKLVKLATNVFWQDFLSKETKIDFGHCEEDIFVDFDSFLAALTHLLGNAAKYAMPREEINFEYAERDGYIVLTLDAASLYVHPEERLRIWEEETRGKEALASSVQGTGLGLGIVRQLLDLNDATILCEWGDTPFSVDGRKYARNRISVAARRAI